MQQAEPLTHKEKERLRSKKYRENNKEKVKLSQRRYREKKAEELREYARKKYLVLKETNPDRLRKYERAYRDRHREKLRLRTKLYREKNRDIVRQQNNERSKRKTIKMKAAIVAGYGGKCVCCNETEPKFLTLDHKFGRKYEFPSLKDKTGRTLYKFLIENNFPALNYQLLCMNCNFAKGLYEVCPHIENRVLAAVQYCLDSCTEIQ